MNKVLNMLSVFHAAGGDAACEAFQKHLLRVPDYLWVSEDGTTGNFRNDEQRSFAHRGEPTGFDTKDLASIIKKVGATVLVGATGRAPGSFDGKEYM